MSPNNGLGLHPCHSYLARRWSLSLCMGSDWWACGLCPEVKGSEWGRPMTFAHCWPLGLRAQPHASVWVDLHITIFTQGLNKGPGATALGVWRFWWDQWVTHAVSTYRPLRAQPQASPRGLAFVHSHVGGLLGGPGATACGVGGYWSGWLSPLTSWAQAPGHPSADPSLHWLYVNKVLGSPHSTLVPCLFFGLNDELTCLKIQTLNLKG